MTQFVYTKYEGEELVRLTSPFSTRTDAMMSSGSPIRPRAGMLRSSSNNRRMRY